MALKKVKIKLTHDELVTLLKLINEQVITDESYKTITPTRHYKVLTAFVVGHVTEFYIKMLGNSHFSYTGRKQFTISPYQGLALQTVIELGWLRTDNRWTEMVLQNLFATTLKQIA